MTSVSFSKDGTHVLSSSYDGLVRVHGIKSGKMLKELRGHTSYVNDAIYSPDGSQVSASDGVIGQQCLASGTGMPSVPRVIAMQSVSSCIGKCT